MTDIHHQDITDKLRRLGKFCDGIIPSKLGLEPSRDQVYAINADLRLLAKRVDEIVEAYALYVTHHTGYQIAADCSADQLSKALDGNLLYEIDEAALYRDELIAEIDADEQYDRWRDDQLANAS
jgi:hypothetical protein